MLLKGLYHNFYLRIVNPEKRNVPLYKNEAFQKEQKRRVSEKQ